MLSNISNSNNGNKTKSVVEKKHYEEIENRLDEMQTEIDANSSAITQNASDIETLDDRIDAVEENSTFESINTDTIYPATGATVILDGDELVTGTLAAHDINTTELTVNGVSFTDVVDNSAQALANSRAANYTANQANAKANEVDGKVANLISSMANELDTDLLKADEGRISSLASDVATIDKITSHEITTDILNADMVKASGKLVRPTIGQSYYTIDIPENCITTLKGTFTVNGVTKRLFVSSTPGSLYYYQESLEIIKSISFNRATGAARIVLKTDSDFDYISISNGDTVTILDGDNEYANYAFIPAKLRGVVTRGFWTNETETVVTGILKAYQLQAENEHFDSTSIDDLFIEESLNVPEQWDQSGIASFSSGLPDQYLSIDTMDGVTHPRWKDSANEATGTLNETNRLVTEESVAKWNGTSCDGTNEYYPITNLGDNTEVHGSATVSGDLTVNGSAHLNADEAIKLHTARCINGTAFDGTADITTPKWGTARTITVQDNDGTNSTTENVDGSADFALSLPATIKADIDGTACNAKCIEIKADSCNAEYNIPFETTSNATYQELGKDSCLKFNPSVNKLTTDRLCGTECVDTPLLKATQADIACNLSVGRNAVIAGDLTVAGTMHVNETENISTGADIISMRTNNTSPLGTGCISGLFINNYDGSNSMVLGTDKNGTFRVGDSAGTSTSYPEIYTDDEHWYNGTYPNGVQFTFSGNLTSYSSLRIETDTSVTPPKTYKIYDDAVITSVDISDMEPLATRAEASDMQDGYAAVWDSTGTDLVTNVNTTKVHGLVSDCKVCGVDFHGTNFYGCLHGDVDGNTATASKVATVSNTTNATFYPAFVDSNNTTAANESVYTDADLNYNPSTNTMSIPNVKATGTVCAACGFTSDGTTSFVIEKTNELNMYLCSVGRAWLNYRGGAACTLIGNGAGTGCGTLVAATVCATNLCGNLTGCFCGCKWYDAPYTANADRKLVLSTGNACAVNDHGVPDSACCSLTFNPATGNLKVDGAVHGNSFVGNVCCVSYTPTSTDEVYFYLGKVSGCDSNGTRLTYSLYGSGIVDSGEITIVNGSNANPFVEWHQSASYNGNTGVQALVITRDCTYWNCPSCYYLRVKPYAANSDFNACVRFLTDSVDKTGIGIKIPTGTPYHSIRGCSLVNWSSAATCVSSSVNTTSTTSNANYYLTFVDSNNTSTTNECVYTNAGLYYNPSTHSLCNVNVAGSNYSRLGAGAADLSTTTPYINLHYNYYSGDYTTRLVDSAQGRFDITVNNGTGSTTATQTANFCFTSDGQFNAPSKVVTPKIESCNASLSLQAGSYLMRLNCVNGLLYNPQGYCIPKVRNTATIDDNAVAGGTLDTSSLATLTCIHCYRSFIGSARAADTNTWCNVISVRYKNGFGDGCCYGVMLYQPMTTSGHWCYKQQYNGAWINEKQLIDSTGGQTITGTLTATTFCGSLNGSAKVAETLGVDASDVFACVENGNELNIYTIGTGWKDAWINCQGGVECLFIGDGTGNGDYGTLIAGTVCATTTNATTTKATCVCATCCVNVCNMTVTSSAAAPISLICGSHKVLLDCKYNVMIGFGACAAACYGVAIGRQASAGSNCSIAIGCLAKTSCERAIAIGQCAGAGNYCGIAIGNYACTCASVDCHVVYSHGSSAHFCFSCSCSQCSVFCVLACLGIQRSPMWPLGEGCTYCGRHFVPAQWTWRNGSTSDMGNWMSWDGDENIDFVAVCGNSHCVYRTCTAALGAKLEIWANWSHDYCY